GMRFVPGGRLSLVDLVSNILLFLPLGFTLAAAFDCRCTGGETRERVRGAAFALGGASALSAGIEFCQVFFASRTLAGSDIVAETFGAAAGIAAWSLAGRELTLRVEAILSRREPPDRRIRWLAVYVIAFCVFQIYPFDVTISPGELSHKYHEGGVQLMAGGLWHLLTVSMLAVP